MKHQYFLLLLALLSSAVAKTIYVDSIVSSHDDSELATTVHELIVAAAETNGNTVLTDKKSSDMVLSGQMHSLGTAKVVSLKLLENKNTVAAVQGKTFVIESMDSLITALVNELFKVSEPQKSRQSEIGSLTSADENKMVKRIKPRTFTSFGIGPAVLINLGSGNLAYLFDVAYYWEASLHGAIKVKADFVADFTGAVHAAGTIGANYYFTATAVSPFIGFDFGYGTDIAGADVYGGFVAGGSVGVVLFRTASTQMILELNDQTLLAGNFPGKVSIGINILH